MANWQNMRTRFTATARAANQMNYLLAESFLKKRRSFWKPPPGKAKDSSTKAQAEGEADAYGLGVSRLPTPGLQMDSVRRLLEHILEQQFEVEPNDRTYNAERVAVLTQVWAANMRDRVQQRFANQRYRVVCLLTIAEKFFQSLEMGMCHLMDKEKDNFVTVTYEQPTFVIVVVLYLVYKD